MKNKGLIFEIVNTVIMLIIVAFTVYPILYVTAVSFSDTTSILAGKVGIFPRGFNLEAYQLMLMDERIPRAYFNSIIYTAVGVLINLAATAISAYPLSKRYFFGKKLYMKMIIISMYFYGGLIPAYLLVNSLHMVDTLWALVIPSAIGSVHLLIMKSFYESLSHAFYEAAYVDGASEYRIMFQIYIPLSKAALASLGIYFFMGHWNSFFTPLIYLNDPRKYPLQLILRDMLMESLAKDTSAVNPEVAKMTPDALKNATIVITMIPVLLVYPFAQKYFIKGMTLGSIKG